MEIRKKRLIFYSTVCVISLILVGFLPNGRLILPVQNATESSYNAKSFWYYPWGKSGTHKGVDIFAPMGTKVWAPCDGIIVNTGFNAMGGNFIVMLGAKWRLHYFAHLNAIYTAPFTYVHQYENIGVVGNTGNAYGKAPHLHYSLTTLVPYFSRADSTPQGYKKIWYLNPIDFFKNQ
jgi:murein DD-endopeptidase MepM/ murein hydrolase activator NlpD